MPTDIEALQSLAQEKESKMCKELVENLPFELPFAFPSFPGNKYQQNSFCPIKVESFIYNSYKILQ